MLRLHGGEGKRNDVGDRSGQVCNEEETKSVVRVGKFPSSKNCKSSLSSISWESVNSSISGAFSDFCEVGGGWIDGKVSRNKRSSDDISRKGSGADMFTVEVTILN